MLSHNFDTVTNSRFLQAQIYSKNFDFKENGYTKAVHLNSAASSSNAKKESTSPITIEAFPS
jgi:hypothetical protein